MESDIAATLATIQTTLENNSNDIKEIKEVLKCHPTRETTEHLNTRITKIEANMGKLTLTIISAVIMAVLDRFVL